MTIQIDLPAELEARLHEQAARQGQAAPEYVRHVVEQELMQQALHALWERTPPQTVAELRARVPSPPGTSWIEHVRGKWPGEESDEEIAEALRELS